MGIFHDSGPAPTACPAFPSPVTDAGPIAGSLTFTELSHWISGIAMGVSSVIAIGLILLHATHMSRPEEQIRIMRIIGLIPAFGLLAFGATYLNVNAIYLMAWLHPCESIAMASFFQLVCVFGQPRPGQMPAGGAMQGGYDQLPPRPKDGPLHPIFPSASMQLRVFQYVPVSIAVAALTCILQAAGKYCFNSNDIHFGHIWLQIVQAISVAIAVMTTIRFTSMNKAAIPQHQVMKKLLTFKGLIFLDFIQTLAFTFAAGKFTPSANFAYTDLTAALPSMILTCEVVLFSIAFFFVYSYRPYTYRGSSGNYSGGFGAIIHAFNPFSLIKDLLTAYY